MSAENIVSFEANIPQARALTVMANQTWILGGRGSGKTQGITAPMVKRFCDAMPRCSGSILGLTFVDLETKILQPVFEGWSMLGFQIETDYVYGRRPPPDWDKPLTPVVDHSRVISFPNGSNIELISMHMKGSANSKSRQFIFAPEIKFFNEAQLKQEVFPILRGHKQHFNDCPYYGAKLFETDKYDPNIHWILAKKKLHNEKLVSSVIALQCKINDLSLHLSFLSDSQAYKIKSEIATYEEWLRKIRRKLVYYGEASALDNLKNLPDDYLEKRKEETTDYEFRVAIMNEDPLKAESGFYPDRDITHLHYKSNDEDVMKPLGVVVDNQASIAPLVSFQVNDLVVPGMETLNFLESIYVKRPFGIKEVIDKFCSDHKMRPCKHVYYFYDHTMIGTSGRQGTVREDVIKFFKANNWTCTWYYMGKAPDQGDKYRRIKEFLKNKGERPYTIQIHGQRCASMVLSMDLTSTKETEKGTKKDKSKETDPNYPQEQAPHFSDCFDMAVWAVIDKGLYPSSIGQPVRVGVF